MEVNKPNKPSDVNAPKSFSTSKASKPMTSYSKSAGASVITGAEKVPQTTIAPKNLKKVFTILGISVLAIVVAITLSLVLVFPTASRVMDIDIDFSANTDIVISGETETRQKLMPGDTLNYTFNLESSRNANSGNVNLDVFLRIRANLDSENNFFPNAVVLTFTDNNQWFKGADGFYYFQKTRDSDGVLSPGEKISISRSLYIDTSVGNEFAGKKIFINFETEVLQAEYQAILELWPTAPYEWSSQFKNLTH